MLVIMTLLRNLNQVTKVILHCTVGIILADYTKALTYFRGQIVAYQPLTLLAILGVPSIHQVRCENTVAERVVMKFLRLLHLFHPNIVLIRAKTVETISTGASSA